MKGTKYGQEGSGDPIALDGRPPELKAVFVKAPRMLDYGEVVKVIDVVKAAGSAPIGLQIDNLDQ